MNTMRATAPLCEALAQALPERPFRVDLWDGSTLRLSPCYAQGWQAPHAGGVGCL